VATNSCIYELLRDPLTGLPNRVLFDDRLRQSLLVAAREARPVAVLVVDIGQYRDPDHVESHDCDDDVLTALAKRLTGVLREPDTVGRLGSDGFGVLLTGSTDADGAAAVAWKILHVLEQPVVSSGLRVQAKASIGIALFPQHGGDPEGLLRRASLAMWEAKRAKNGFALFAAVEDEGAAGHAALMSDLQHCISRQELVLDYQPQVDMATGRTLGVEALVRWTHPSRGLLGPDLFMPLVERSGLIGPLTEWVLDEALHQLRQWRDSAIDLTMSVNLSARSLEGFDIVGTVAQLTESWDVPPDKLTLEITEGALINASAPAVLERLHHMGERLSIDDYGTGYSSLAYLQRLPVHEIKIDKSFVIDLASGTESAKIVHSTIDLGHDLGLTVCAEGVEDEHAHQMLIGYGCDVAQGYFISRPLPAQGVLAWLGV
jgi:diguanylate cyclase (GGDEF)-like protein